VDRGSAVRPQKLYHHPLLKSYGYLIAAHARRLSSHTLADYSTTFRKLAQHLKTDPPIASITVNQVRAFLAARRGISKKTLLNMHVGLSESWAWATHQGIVPHYISHDISTLRPEQHTIEPFTESDIRAMLSSLDKSKSY